MDKNNPKLKELLYNLSEGDEKANLSMIETNQLHQKLKDLEQQLKDLLKESKNKADGQTLQSIREIALVVQETRRELKNITDNVAKTYAQTIEHLSSKINVDKIESDLKEIHQQFLKSHGGLMAAFVMKLNEAGKSISQMKVGTETVPLYKAMIEGISGVKEAVEKKPTPVWQWPQYASVSVRNKNFSNIDPAVAYQNASTTETAPYGTLPVFDNAGVIAKVSNSVGLPVNIVAGSISTTISSPTLSGLSVNLTKATTAVLAGLKVLVENPQSSVSVSNFPSTQNVSITAATTSVLSGLQVVLNGSKSTVPVSISGNQAVNIAAATTSVLAGLKTFVENFPTTQNVNITAATTSSLAGLKVLQENTAVPFVTTTTVGITASASGDNTIVGAQGTGKQIYVYAWNLSFSGTVNAKFTDAVTSKLLCGLIYGVADAGGANSVSPNFLINKPQPDLFHTSPNSRLLLNLSGSTAVGGNVSFFVI